MAIKKVSKAKNLSAGPSKMTKKAGPVDPQGKWTGVQKRTLGSMKKGGKMMKAQNGKTVKTVDLNNSNGLFAPITLNKEQAEKYKNVVKQRKASADSSAKDFNRRLQEAKQKVKSKSKS